MTEPGKPADGKVLRLDFAPLRGARVTPQGFLRVDASLGRTGVLTYQTPQGPRRELRLPEEVFRADSMATAAGAVVTDLHPPVAEAFISPANYRKFAIGFVGDEVRQDGDHVAGSLVIQDERVLDLVRKGERREISPGYLCRLDMQAGTWNGQEYDCIQRGIAYNSVGIGPRGWGRQGSDVAMRLDGLDATTAVLRCDGTALGDFIGQRMLEQHLTLMQLAEATGIVLPKASEPEPLLRVGDMPSRGYVLQAILDGWTPRPSDEQLKALAKELGVELDTLINLIPSGLRQDGKSTSAGNRAATKKPTRKPMEEIELRLDGVSITLDKRDGALVQKAIDERDTKIKQLGTEHSALQARLDGLTDQHAKLKTELETLPAKLRAEMNERAALESQARRVLGADMKLDGKSDRQVRETVLAKLSPDLKLDGKDDTYVAVRFDVALEGFKEPSASDKVRAAITGGSNPQLRTDAGDAQDPAVARAKMIERDSNAWKNGSQA